MSVFVKEQRIKERQEMRHCVDVIKGKRSFFDYIRCVSLFELSDYLNMKHQVSPVDIFHHIIKTVLRNQNRHTLS